MSINYEIIQVVDIVSGIYFFLFKAIFSICVFICVSETLCKRVIFSWAYKDLLHKSTKNIVWSEEGNKSLETLSNNSVILYAQFDLHPISRNPN